MWQWAGTQGWVAGRWRRCGEGRGDDGARGAGEGREGARATRVSGGEGCEDKGTRVPRCVGFYKRGEEGKNKNGPHVSNAWGKV